MKNVLKITVSILFIALTVSGCYLPMTGTIVDAETNKPIEGAVVLVEWTKTKGIGLTYTESYKVAETLTSKDGKFVIPGIVAPAVNPPDLTIYKQGYVAWNNKIIFPRSDKRVDFEWRNYAVMKIERIKEPFNYYEHYSFIMSVVRIESAIENKKMFFNAYDQAERKKAVLDMDKLPKGGVHK